MGMTAEVAVSAWLSRNTGRSFFDPAVHYGDRETDIAMTRLFGGYGRQAEGMIEQLLAELGV
jgi:fructosamine-3-kinase